MLDAAGLLRRNLPLVLGLAVAGVATGVWSWRTGRLRPAWDALTTNVVPFRDVTRALAAGCAFRMLGSMLQSGVPLVDALRLCRRGLRNSYYRKLFARLEDDVVNGRGMSLALLASPVVPRGAAQMAQTAERTGKLGGVLETVGEFYEAEGERRLRELAKLLEPLIIAVLGAVVAAVVLGKVLTIPEPLARAAATALRSAKLEPRTLDGLPLALARAVDFAEGTAAPRAVLDLGYCSATFAIVAAGVPVFTCVLRGGGMRDWVRAIAAEFELPEAETDDLLVDVAAPGPGPDFDRTRAEFAELIGPAADAGRETVVAELRRSLAFLAERRPDLAPEELLLFGGGATVPGTVECLAARLGLPTRGWRHPTTDDGRAVATPFPSELSGVAAALSALAWEP